MILRSLFVDGSIFDYGRLARNTSKKRKTKYRMATRGLEGLVERSPAEYFCFEDETEELVVTSIWKDLVSNGLIRSEDDSILMHQVFDIFDTAILHGIRSLVVDAFQEVSANHLKLNFYNALYL